MLPAYTRKKIKAQKIKFHERIIHDLAQERAGSYRLVTKLLHRGNVMFPFQTWKHRVIQKDAHCTYSRKVLQF